MPRLTGQAAAPQDAAPATLVASAVNMPGKATSLYSKPESWQQEAWRHYDICGELRYACAYIGNILSRASLHAAKQTENGPQAVTTGPPADLLHELTAGASGQEEMLKAFGVHLTVAGECYLIAYRDDDGDQWGVFGTEEVKKTGGKWKIDKGAGKFEDLEDSDTVIRIWRPHPKKRIAADSPVRALLPILTQIEYLTRHIHAQVQSRLAGNGILFMPSNLTFPGVKESGNEASAFMQVLGEGMMTPLKDPSNPSALVPIVVTADSEQFDKIKHMTFWSELDQHAADLLSSAIRRLALGLEIPPEVLLGTADSNHWSGWIVEESTIKAHIEPLLGLITNALTVGYLRPALKTDEFLVAYETSRMRLRPNRSQEAIELYDRGELDGQALRRETGFSEDDVPDDTERRDWFLRKVASGSTTPEQVAQALEMLGVMKAQPSGDPTPDVPREARPTPSLQDHPTQEIPDTLTSSGVLTAANAMVVRALERAGNKAKATARIKPPGLDPFEVYRVIPVRDMEAALEGAWTSAPKMMGHLSCDVERVTSVCDRYTRNLLATGREHHIEDLQKALALA